MKIKYSTKRIDAIKTLGIASDYIAHIDGIKPGPVVLYVRVSRRHQDESLPAQETNLQRELQSRGFSVLEVFMETASGWAGDRIQLERAPRCLVLQPCAPRIPLVNLFPPI
ncbi:MAG: recombinase family protein [Verrucomicrobia bacterium]|nr:recombinase family protein [Verrucomicrobiota bacterium]